MADKGQDSARHRAAARASDGAAPPERRHVYLHPGDMAAVREPHELTTILGSCVAVCLWDRRQRIGGANHFLLPHWAGAEERSTRFGSVAMVQLLDRMRDLGCDFADMDAKVFGGARVLAGSVAARTPIGLQNVDLAMSMLGAAGLRVAASDVGGEQARKLLFHTDDGSVWIKRL